MRIRSILFLLSGWLLFSCDAGLDGQLRDNIPPKTYLTVNEINLPEGDRLVSQVNISWWADDPDGYVVGFEFLILEESRVPRDSQGNPFCQLPAGVDSEWTFTNRSDSTFVLPIEEGNTDADVAFFVRAVDNKQTVDPEPPCLIFPIRNSPPVINFRPIETPPDTTYRVVSFGWVATDPDGDANLNRIEISLNNQTDWQVLQPNVNFITIRVDDTITPPVAQIFSGRAVNQTGLTFNEVNLNAENTLYIRAIDNAGAVSTMREHTWYLKQQTSRILYVDDYPGTVGDQRRALHLALLAENGITQVDYLSVRDGEATGGRRVPFSAGFPDRSLAAPTINKMLAEWDHIYWVSNDLDRNIGYALELTLDFFNNGGTMFINIPTKNLLPDNNLFEFLPFQGFETVPTGFNNFVINANSLVIPNPDLQNPPVLRFSRQLTAARPIIPFGETVNLFEADYKVRPFFGAAQDFQGNKLIAATNPDQSILYFGIDINEFTADSERARLIELTCIEILGFQP
jgi:hypothetical protein